MISFRQYLTEGFLKSIASKFKKKEEKGDGRAYDPQDEHGYSDKYDRKKTTRHISNLKQVEKLKGKSDTDY